MIAQGAEGQTLERLPEPDAFKGKRLAIVVSHPTQYYSPWFRWIKEHTSLDFAVFYLWQFGVHPTRDAKFGATFAWDVDLLSGYEHRFVPNVARDPGTHHFAGLRNPDLVRSLAAWKADAVLLFGYRYWSHLVLLSWARFHGIPVLFRGDSHFLGRARPALAARLALGLLYRQIQGFLYVGSANKDYFRAFSVPESKLFFAPHSVNDALFRPTPSHESRASDLRGELGIGDRRVLLFAGKFIPGKQPLQLLKAFLAKPRPGWAIVFVGDGSERRALEETAAANPGAVVRFLPFANQSEMPSRYLLADLFVLPSAGFYETWGLAINEAMLMGVPCIVSDRVGCQRDLVIPDETGWVFEAGSPQSLEAVLDTATADLESPGRRDSLKKALRERMETYTYRRAAAGLLEALAVPRK